MKKLLPAILVLLIAGSAIGFFALRKHNFISPRPEELAPANAVLFVELPDIPRTAGRWEQTALHQLWNEPEVQAFAEKPESKVSAWKEFQSEFSQFQQTRPGRAFFALASLDGETPSWVGGFTFSAGREAVEKALSSAHTQLHQMWPAGRADIEYYNKVEIQTYSDRGKVIAEAFDGNWYLVANQLGLLKETLDRAAAKQKAACLNTDEIFHKALGPLPNDSELLIFARASVFTDKLTELVQAAGQKTDPEQIDQLKKIKAISFTTKIDGANFRDSFFTYTPGTTKEQPLSMHGLGFSTVNTLLYSSMAMPSASGPADAGALTSLAQLLPAFADFQNSLGAQGLSLTDIPVIFGPQWNFLLDWTPTAVQPAPLFSVDVRDSVKAAAFVTALTGGEDHSSGWTKRTGDGASIYSPPPIEGIALSPPSIGISDKLLILGSSPESVSEALVRIKSGKEQLAIQPSFSNASKAVATPTVGFGYIDLKGLIERSYGILRPFLAMSLAFSPDAGQYVDAGKLPTTETLTKHLAPVVYSQAVVDDGTIMESCGPLTFNQILGAVAVGVGATALPNIEQSLQNGGSLLPPNLFPMPGFGPKPAPAPPTAPAPPQQNAPGGGAQEPKQAPKEAMAVLQMPQYE